MGTLETATVAVNLDEPAYSLRELNEWEPGRDMYRRWQIIRVVRNDRLVTWRHDLGDASKFDALQFIIPGGVVEEGKPRVWETVGSLRDMADKLREDKAEDRAVPDMYWLTLYHEEKERRKHPYRKIFAKES